METLYQRLLGPRFADLNPVLQRFHSSRQPITGVGLFRVVHHPGWFRRLLVKLMGLPAAGDAIEVTVEVTPTGDGERWGRSFAGRPMVTFQTAKDEMLMERGGPIRFGIALAVVDGGMTFRTRSVWFLGVPLPRWLGPSVDADVVPKGEGWSVVVRLTLPLVGRLLEYDGEVILQWT